MGWGPQQLAVELIDDLRQGFLLKVAPELAEVTGESRSRLLEQGEQLGLARIVRAIELIGRSQVEMRDAPDPLVIFEVAVVRAARSDLDPGAGALQDRIDRLERRLGELESGTTRAPAPAAMPPAGPAVDPPAGERAALGAYRRQRGGAVPAPAAAPAGVAEEPEALDAAPVEVPAAVEEPAEPAPLEPVANVAPGSVAAGPEAVIDAWTQGVLPQLRSSVRPLFANAPAEVDGSVLHVTVPSEQYLKKCSDHVAQLEELLCSQLGTAISVQLAVGRVVEDAGSASRGLVPRAEPQPVEEIEDIGDIDLHDLVDAPSTGSIGTSKIFEAFPGAVEEEA